MRSQACLSLTIASLLAGCASGSAQFNTRSYERTAEPVKRLVFNAIVRSSDFDGPLHDAFVQEVRDRIASCGIIVTTLVNTGTDAEMKRKAGQAIRENQAELLLTILRQGSNLVRGAGGRRGSIYFETKAWDTRTNKLAWQAKIDYHVGAENEASGARFASQFVSRLATDKVITGCPANVVSPGP